MEEGRREEGESAFLVKRVAIHGAIRFFLNLNAYKYDFLKNLYAYVYNFKQLDKIIIPFVR